MLICPLYKECQNNYCMHSKPHIAVLNCDNKRKCSLHNVCERYKICDGFRVCVPDFEFLMKEAINDKRTNRPKIS